MFWNKEIINYREPLFRPPAEADSLIFQVAYGCPHNRCRFCGMYKSVRYNVRPNEDVIAEFRRASQYYPETRRVFLADGDAMLFTFDRLKSLLEELNRCFPMLARVNLYANGSSILSKTPEQLRVLKNLKLNTLYMGLESGDQTLLDKVDKGEKIEDMITAVTRAQEQGLKASVMILIGLAGRDGSARHAALTASVLNRMQPRLLSALRFIEVPGAEMYEGYRPITEYEAGAELLSMVEQLELRKTVFRANHTSNPVPLEGRFPQDKSRLVNMLQTILHSGGLDRSSPGRLPWSL